MRASVTLSTVAASNWIPVNWKQHPFEVGLGLVVTGTNTSKVEVCHENILAGETPVPLDHETLSAETASIAGHQTTPVTAVRLNMSVATSGSATLTVMQAVK